MGRSRAAWLEIDLEAISRQMAKGGMTTRGEGVGETLREQREQSPSVCTDRCSEMRAWEVVNKT